MLATFSLSLIYTIVFVSRNGKKIRFLWQKCGIQKGVRDLPDAVIQTSLRMGLSSRRPSFRVTDNEPSRDPQE